MGDDCWQTVIQGSYKMRNNIHTSPPHESSADQKAVGGLRGCIRERSESDGKSSSWACYEISVQLRHLDKVLK